MMQQTHSSEGATLLLKDRAQINVSGVEEVLAFDETAITCRTTLGDLVIEGSSLRIVDFCAEKGEFTAVGRISLLAYDEGHDKKKGLFGLFAK